MRSNKQAHDEPFDLSPGPVRCWTEGQGKGRVISYVAIERRGDLILATRQYWGFELPLRPVFECEQTLALAARSLRNSTVIWRNGMPVASVSLHDDGSLCAVKF